MIAYVVIQPTTLVNRRYGIEGIICLDREAVEPRVQNPLFLISLPGQHMIDRETLTKQYRPCCFATRNRGPVSSTKVCMDAILFDVMVMKQSSGYWMV